MKGIICVLLAIALCLSCACAQESEHFEFAALDELWDGAGNQLISPVSLAYALGMAARGAEGETKQEILELLDMEDVASLTALSEALEKAGLRQANAAFVAEGVQLSEDYISALEAEFGAEWFENGEDAADQINAWVNEHTDGMIEKLVEELPPEILLTLVNAIVMDAKWMKAFDPNSTWEDVFHAPEGDVNARFMHETFHADYGERDGVQLLRLQYRDDDYEPTGLSMLIALPEAGGVEALLDDLRAEGLGYFKFDEQQARLDLSMPKVDISASNTMNDVLKALSVNTAFSDRADFSGISEEIPLKINQVLQKARLTMDEEGTKAAAVTAVMMETMMMPDPEEIVEFNMNRPFVLAVVHEESGAVCFAGVVTNPTAN